MGKKFCPTLKNWNTSRLMWTVTQQQHPKHCFQMYFKWWGRTLFFPKEFCTTEVHKSLAPCHLGDWSLCGSAVIFVFPVYLLVLVTILAPVILRWLLDFWKTCFTPSHCSFAQNATVMSPKPCLDEWSVFFFCYLKVC